jgi:dCMP deaminase
MDFNDFQFMKIAYSAAKFNSNNPRTNVGATISKNYKLLAIGANSAPNGLNLSHEMLEREKKGFYLNHAERKAINECAKYGNSTRDSVMHLTWKPCSTCALEIIDSGIKELVLHKDLDDYYKLNVNQDNILFKDQNIALEMMKDLGVKVRYLEGRIFDLKDNFFINFKGKKFFP